MFERLNTPEEAFNYKLGAALKMEHTVLEKILEDNIEEAKDDKLKGLLRHHQDETRQQIGNLEQTFSAFGWESYSFGVGLLHLTFIPGPQEKPLAIAAALRPAKQRLLSARRQETCHRRRHHPDRRFRDASVAIHLS